MAEAAAIVRERGEGTATVPGSLRYDGNLELCK